MIYKTDEELDEMTRKWDLRFLGLAKHIASWSKDPSTKVGAVITSADHHIISVGFNGFPRWMKDEPQLYLDRAEKYSRIVHAEMNALIFAQQQIPYSSSLYTYPFIPCDRCCVQFIQTGIDRFVSIQPSAEHEGRWGEQLARTRQYAREVGIEVMEYSCLI